MLRATEELRDLYSDGVETLDRAETFILDEVGAVDGDLLPGILRYLESITRPDGGVPWVLPTQSPRGPWWVPVDGLPGSINPTASIVGPLLKNGIENPWVHRATEFCWSALDAMIEPSPYDVRSALKFLESVPDRDRAQVAWSRLGQAVLDHGVTLRDNGALK